MINLTGVIRVLEISINKEITTKYQAHLDFTHILKIPEYSK